jgi:hypothetical protein
MVDDRRRRVRSTRVVPCGRRCATVLHRVCSVAVFRRRSAVVRRGNRRRYRRNGVHPPRAAGRDTRARRGRDRRRRRHQRHRCVRTARAKAGIAPRGIHAFHIGRACWRTDRIGWIVRARIHGRRTSVRRHGRQTWRRVGQTVAGDRERGRHGAHTPNLGQRTHRMRHRKLLPHHLCHHARVDLPIPLSRLIRQSGISNCAVHYGNSRICW